MNYSVFKLTESDNGYFFFFLSPFDGNDMELVAEQIEHYIANVPTQMNQYLMNVDFDTVKIEKVDIPITSVISNSFQSDDKNMLVSTSYVSLIPPPKQKRISKPKAEGKEPKPKAQPKPRGKKAAQAVEINTNGDPAAC